jgi:hypothetical protein
MRDSRGYELRLGDWLRQVVIVAAVLLCVTGVKARAQVAAPSPSTKTMLVEPPAPLLPATLGKLTRSSDGDVGDGLGKMDAAGLSAQDQAAVTEDGLKLFAQSDYADGTEHGTVSVFRFMDASGAISAFDYFRRAGAVGAAKMGDQAAPSEDGKIVFRSGVNVVRETFNPHGEHVGSLMGELIDHLPKVGGTAAMAPLLPSLLPAKGFEADSVKYALGPKSYAAMGGVLPAELVGFDKSAEAVTAKSTAKPGGVLTLLLYPTPEIAGEHLRMIEQAMKQQGAAAGTVILRREGPLVAMTSGAWKPDAAQAMVDSVHLRSEVTFDKPMPVEFHAEVKKTYSLLMSITIFSGIAFLAAVVLGLFFGGGRALVRVMQGKPAASEPEFLRIDLREAATKRLIDPKG